MREGRAYINYHNLYGYGKGDDRKPKIDPGHAEVVREIFKICIRAAQAYGQ